LLFPPHTDEASSALPFNGRVQKIVSVFAGYASARFNLHMNREAFDVLDAGQMALRERVERCEAHFDARVFSLDTLAHLSSYIRWRAVHDCRRNSISMLAQAHFDETQLHGAHSGKKLALLEAKGVRWEDTPPFFRHGTYVKREAFFKRAFNPKTKQPVRPACSA
jgi:tRNA(His) guanylyltransferase